MSTFSIRANSISLIIGVIVGYVFFKKETKIQTIQTQKEVLAVKNENNEKISKVSKDKVVYRTITKYDRNQKIKEKIDEKVDESTNNSSLLLTNSIEETRIQVQERKSTITNTSNNNYSFGILVNIDPLLSNGPRSSNIEIIATRNIIWSFDLAVSAEFKEFEYQNAKVGLIYRW